MSINPQLTDLEVFFTRSPPQWGCYEGALSCDSRHRLVPSGMLAVNRYGTMEMEVNRMVCRRNPDETVQVPNQCPTSSGQYKSWMMKSVRQIGEDVAATVDCGEGRRKSSPKHADVTAQDVEAVRAYVRWIVRGPSGP